MAGSKHGFENGQDYVFLEDRGVLSWKGKSKPDDGTLFEVTYSFKEPSGLTDTSPGSVLRTMVESIAKELDNVYEQMDGVYKSAFIDTAIGAALDNVAAIIGVERKPPTRAMGTVTFWRDSDPPEVAITDETILYDGRELYQLNEGPLKNISAVRGIVKGIQFTFTKAKDFEMNQQKNSLMWLVGGSKPDNNTPFSTDYTIYEKIMVRQGMIITNSASLPADTKSFETMHNAVLQKSESGKWEADVQIRAMAPGQQGNVQAGTITQMPKPAIGVEHVINRAKLVGGADLESDDALKGRAKQALELAGKATIGSLHAALESIEGIQSAPRIKENPDGVVGLVKVVIDGGSEEEINKAIEDTRAAGIRVEFYRPKVVSLDFEISVIPKMSRLSSTQAESLKAVITMKIRDFVSALKIDQDLIYNQLLSTILRIEDIQDVRSMTIDIFRDGVKVGTSLRDNIMASEDENLSPRSVSVVIETENVQEIGT